MREGLVRSDSFHVLHRPRAVARAPSRGRQRATPSRPPSRPRPSRSSSPAATCSPAPRPAPARRPPSCCRCSSACTPAGPTGRRAIRALILAPTRELALQVEESVRTYGRRATRSARSPSTAASASTRRSARCAPAPEIVVATPGRLLDHVGSGRSTCRSVEILVLDEADRMLDMGFIRDIRKILAPAAGPSPEPAVLGHLLRRDPAAGGRPPPRAGHGPGHAAQHRVGAGRAGRPSGRPRAQARAAQPPRQERRALPGPGLHPHQARREPARPAARDGRHPVHRDPRQQEPAAARARPGRLQGRTGSRSSSPPRSPPAASTSTRCRTS